MRDFYVVAILFSLLQGANSCIPMHVDEPVVTTTPILTTTTTPKPDPCKGCVPPGVRASGFPTRCKPDTPGTVSVSMIADGDKCILSPTGCPIGYYFVLDENQCSFTLKPPGPIKTAVCKNGNFYYGQNLLTYFVGGCSTFDF